MGGAPVHAMFEQVYLRQQKALDDLRQLTATASLNGNSSYDEYLFGVANGLILALSIFEDREPVFLNKPERWLRATGEPR